MYLGLPTTIGILYLIPLLDASTKQIPFPFAVSIPLELIVAIFELSVLQLVTPIAFVKKYWALV